MFSRFVSAPLAQGLFPRVRRDVMEGNWEELLDNLKDNMEVEKHGASNGTFARLKRQIEIPVIPEQDNTK